MISPIISKEIVWNNIRITEIDLSIDAHNSDIATEYDHSCLSKIGKTTRLRK